MKSYVTRQQVREINRKLFANDLIYSEEDNKNTLETLLYDIIIKYDPTDKIAGVPTIIEIKEESLNKDLLEKINLLNTQAVIFQVNNKMLEDHDNIDIIQMLKADKFSIIVELNKDDSMFTIAKILADYIKFDIQNIPDGMQNEVFTCKKLAYNVNTPEDFALAETAHIDLYEGTYISPSSRLEIDDIKHSRVNFLELIALINNSSTKLEDVVKVIQRDSLISAQLIRLSNSAYFGGRKRTESIEKAVIRLGLENIKKWVFLLQFSTHNNESDELIRQSYHKAIFCESIVKSARLKDISPSEAYLIGLFSLIDTLTGKPMDSEITKLHLTEVVEDALVYREGIGGQLLNLIKAYEEGKWNKVDKYIATFKLNKDKIYRLYFNSLEAVTKLWKELTRLQEGSDKTK